MTDSQSPKRSYKSVFGGLPYARWKWGEDPHTIPYGYLKPTDFKKHLTRLLQLKGCTQENYDRWVQMYEDRRKAKGEQHSRRQRVRGLWKPIFDRFDREEASCNSSLKYYGFQVHVQQADDKKPHIEANLYYREVLRRTRSRLYRECVLRDVTPKDMLERLQQESPERRLHAYPDQWKDWEQYVPLKQQKIIREMFAALPRNYRGKRKLPFAIRYRGENSRATEAHEREINERKEQERQYDIKNWDTDKKSLSSRSWNDFWLTEDELKEMGEIPADGADRPEGEMK